MGLDIHVAALGDWVRDFTRVNNHMAGIMREPTAAEVGAHRGLLAVNSLRVENVELFVHHISPGTSLRDACDAESSTKTDRADLRADLSIILTAARMRSAPPDRLYRLFRMVRPFTDANGRCGRALWMWQLMRGTRQDLAEIAELDLLDTRHPLNADAVALSAMM